MYQQIENLMNKIEAVKGSLYEVKKIQLHTGLEGFNSPEAYATYKTTGGNALGVVGSVFEPADLNLLFDSLTQTMLDCDITTDIADVKFTEFRDGARCQFEIILPNKEIKGSPMVGDVIRQSLVLRTGFDGLTKTALSFQSYRLWCSNGSGSWKKDVELALKNTLRNHVKVMTFCDDLLNVAGQADEYVKAVGSLASKKVTQKKLDEFLKKLTGFEFNEYKDLTTKRRNILDRINEAVAIEANNTGWNEFSLLQGITRYTTHDLCGGDANHPDLLFANAGKLSDKAHALLLN